MATITSLGVGSGLDLNGLLEQLQSAERQKLAPVTERKSDEQSKISAYGRLQSTLGRLQEAVAGINDPAVFQQQKSEVSGDNFTATADETANAGRYEVTVNQLASSGSVASDSVAQGTVVATADSTLTLNFGATYTNGEFDDAAAPLSTYTLNVAAGSTLEDVRDQINDDAEAGVTASIVNDGSGYRLALSTKDTGKDASIIGFEGLDQLSMDDATLRAGKDAELNVNGIAITSRTNQVEEAIQGVTIDLVSISDEPISLTIDRDKDALREAVDNFVATYNEMKSTVGRMTAYNGEEESSGELIGDRTVRTIEQRLRRDMSDSVAGGEFELLSQFGITLNERGRLDVDDSKLDEAIANNPQGLTEFFAGDSEEAGWAGRLNATLDTMLSGDGIVQNSIESAEQRVENLDNRLMRMETSIERTVERYRKQFGQLDGMVAQMNQMSSYLAQQLMVMNTQ